MIGSLILMAGLTAAHPAPLLAGKCKVSKLWGTTVPAEIPMEQQRHLIHVQGKQIFWNTRAITQDRAVAEVGAEMAQGSDMLVIDASAAKCATVEALAAAIEGPAACTPERCFVTDKSLPPRTEPKAAR